MSATVALSPDRQFHRADLPPGLSIADPVTAAGFDGDGFSDLVLMRMAPTGGT